MQDYHNTLRQVSLLRRKHLLPLIYAYTGGRIISGPFQDMIITPNYVWGDGDTTSKLLGIYEDELHSYIEKGISMQPDLIINVGCAEAYYAIGLKKRTGAKTIAVDVDTKCFDIAKINATANSVEIDDLVTEIPLIELDSLLNNFKTPWLVLDCEGYENILLDPSTVPNLRKSIVLVETHDCYINNLTEILSKRMNDTHNIEFIQQGNKNPFKIDLLRYIHETDKWCLLDEGRGQNGTWLWMEPK